jgi:regulator of protease activity HflC (stomatin/prohibitin superfamily)
MFISAIFGLIALVGVLLLVGGIFLAFAAVGQKRSARGGVILAVIGLLVTVVFGTISQGVVIVEPTEVAVIVNPISGEISQRQQGLHIITPVVQRVAQLYTTTQIAFTMSANPSEGDRNNFDAVEANTRDGQRVFMDITVIYRVNSEEAAELYETWGTRDFEDEFVRPVTRSVTRDIVSQYSAEEIYSTRRQELGPDIQEALGIRFTEGSLILAELVVREIQFEEAFTAAVLERAVAQQNRDRARIDAERVETEAEGRANAAIAAANGEAQSIEIRARAEAEALRVVSEVIAANPSLIQYLYVQNLSDNINLALVPSDSPFLFDLNNMMTPATQSVPESTPTPGS